MTDNKIRIAIVGYGNVGKGVHKAIKNNPDMELDKIITRDPLRVREELAKSKDSEIRIFPMGDLEATADVAILCGDSKKDLPVQGPRFAKYFNTIDSFDTHANIPEYFEKMDKISKENEKVSIISTGWDPGTFSLERVLADAFIPLSKKYTFWGPGVSQGHSDAIRQVDGVKDAIQFTMPIVAAIYKARSGENPNLTTREKHWRKCYVVLKEDAVEEEVRNTIKAMPNYFADYNTRVTFVSQEKMNRLKSRMPHGGFVITTGKTGKENKARIEYICEWGSNPEATGNILVAHARAAYRLRNEGKTGAFTILDIPASYLSPHSREKLLKEFM